MRIAIAAWSRRKVGGAESYLTTVIPALANAGHEVALFCEVDRPADREPITIPAGAPVWCIEQVGTMALDRLRNWQPDLVYGHGLADPSLENLIIAGRRSIRFAHNQSGLCISGTKTFAFPRRRGCGNSLGWRCLVNYYPRRCGGLSPATAWRLYRREMHHLQLLRLYSAIVMGSSHLRREFIRQGLDANRVRLIPYPLSELADPPRPDHACGGAALRNAGELRILFAGQMLKLKGGDYLIDAAPAVAAALRRPIRLILVGDGPARPAWEVRAARVRAARSDLAIEFRGWLSGVAYEAAGAEADLIAIPSLMQEAFGLSGLEAARHGVPAVAYAVGGIPEWCIDGINGHLAPGDPPTVRGLAQAIVKCLGDSAHYRRLCESARCRARQFSLDGHVEQLSALFDEIAA